MSALATSCAVDDREGAGVWFVTLEGDHDISTVLGIEQQTREVWPSCSLVVVDLTAVGFIDGSVVNWLLRTRTRLAADGHHALRIVRGPPGGSVELVFEILRLDQEFACYQTRKGALSRLPPIARRTHATFSRSTSLATEIEMQDREMVE